MTQKKSIEFTVAKATVVSDGILVSVEGGQVKFPPGTKLEVGGRYQVSIDPDGVTKLGKGEVVPAATADKVVATGASSPPTGRDW